MSDTKLIQLKLKAPKLKQILKGAEIAVQNGWLFSDTAHDYTPKIGVYYKEVEVTSPWPSENVWNCRDPFPLEPMIVSQEVFDTLLKAIEDDSEKWENGELGASKEFVAVSEVMSTVENAIKNSLNDLVESGVLSSDLSKTKDFSASAIVKISDNNTIQIDKDETVVDTLQTEVLDIVTFSRTPDGFEMRPYTLEDLAEIKWSDLTKLSAALGVSDGKRPERELAIVKASLEQWG